MIAHTHKLNSGKTNSNLQLYKPRSNATLTTIVQRLDTTPGTIGEFAPKYTLYDSEIISGWRLIQPIQLTLEQEEDGTYILSDELFDEYGEGETLEQAKQDYVANLIAYYEILSERASRPENQRLFARIQRCLVKLD